MNKPSGDLLTEEIERRAVPLGEPAGLQELIERVREKKIVMLGESTHGTQDFYHWRRLITEWLIVKHGFRFVAVEGDWPPCQEINEYVVGSAKGGHARDVLRSFRRWPTWMWSNTESVRLVEWMRSHNLRAAGSERVEFFGMDVYSLFESIDAVLTRLDEISPLLARRARKRYECFDPFQENEKSYVRSLIEYPEGCEQEVLEVLKDLLKVRLDGIDEREDALFDARQNARIVANAERYYRSLLHADGESWNIRDRHMLDTLEILLDRFGPDTKGIVWAHNTHIGDYRATDMLSRGEINVGGLARERWGEADVALVGFGTHRGEAIASHAWDGPAERMEVPPGRIGSYEEAFHRAASRLKQNAFHVPLTGRTRADDPFSEMKGHRAIGVVYHPAYERFGNYVPTVLSGRYDDFVFVDRSSAVEPLEQEFDRGEIPEAWPSGQ